MYFLEIEVELEWFHGFQIWNSGNLEFFYSEFREVKIFEFEISNYSNKKFILFYIPTVICLLEIEFELKAFSILKFRIAGI